MIDRLLLFWKAFRLYREVEAGFFESIRAAWISSR
jgi:hypothetical protein